MSDGGSAQSGADERGSLSPAPPTPEAVRRAKKEAAAAARSEEVAREMCEHQPPGPPLPSIAWSPEGSPDLSLIHISEPTRLLSISYAVFCLKKKKKKNTQLT
eukprot:TRINITY_DN17407_c0_g1_i1.p1 TRINITY_DN17407_c0_g1~~TRINITY_DN17407_c0_g1_i1.p1  ORF type:complete len:103 (-),score=31.32 TRINITY_DN17407_c0_g1_i1:31-339(-)